MESYRHPRTPGVSLIMQAWLWTSEALSAQVAGEPPARVLGADLARPATRLV